MLDSMPALVLVALLASCATPPRQVVYVVAEREYGTAESLRAFHAEHLEHEGWEATWIEAPPDGPGRHQLVGMVDALPDADLVVLSVRRRAPPIEELDALRAYLERGGGLVALRTSSHAFHLRGAEPPLGHGVWETFDVEVLGAAYLGHHGDEEFEIAARHPLHPLVDGATPKRSRKLYRFDSRVHPILLGAPPFGPDEFPSIQPVAWLHHHGDARVFATSLGLRQDFTDPAFCELLRRGMEWAAGDRP